MALAVDGLLLAQFIDTAVYVWPDLGVLLQCVQDIGSRPLDGK